MIESGTNGSLHSEVDEMEICVFGVTAVMSEDEDRTMARGEPSDVLDREMTLESLVCVTDFWLPFLMSWAEEDASGGFETAPTAREDAAVERTTPVWTGRGLCLNSCAFRDTSVLRGGGAGGEEGG